MLGLDSGGRWREIYLIVVSSGRKGKEGKEGEEARGFLLELIFLDFGGRYFLEIFINSL